MPWVIRRSPRQVQHAFLRGLFDADGGVNRTTVHLTCASKRLATEVHLMLFHSDIVARLVEMPNDHAGAWRVETTGKHSRRYMDLVGFKSQEKTDTFQTLNLAANVGRKGVPKSNISALPDSIQAAQKLRIQHSLTKKNGISQLASRCVNGKSRLHMFHIPYIYTHLDLTASEIGQELLRRSEDGLFYCPVVSIDNGRCVMLDLEIENQHAFVTNGIVSHNCQGASLDCIEIDISRCFEHGQAYVALSRVRSLEGLSLKSEDFSRITAHPIVKTFYSQLRGRAQQTQQTQQTQQAQQTKAVRLRGDNRGGANQPAKKRAKNPKMKAYPVASGPPTIMVRLGSVSAPPRTKRGRSSKKKEVPVKAPAKKRPSSRKPKTQIAVKLGSVSSQSDKRARSSSKKKGAQGAHPGREKKRPKSSERE